MAGMKKYFDYKCGIICGLQNVTLKGSPADWKQLRQWIDRIPEWDVYNPATNYTHPMFDWHRKLAPVLNEFYNTSCNKINMDFWRCIEGNSPHHAGNICGDVDRIHGWPTVFGMISDGGFYNKDSYLSMGDFPADVANVILDVDGQKYVLNSGLMRTVVTPSNAITCEIGWGMRLANARHDL